MVEFRYFRAVRHLRYLRTYHCQTEERFRNWFSFLWLEVRTETMISLYNPFVFTARGLRDLKVIGRETTGTHNNLVKTL